MTARATLKHNEEVHLPHLPAEPHGDKAYVSKHEWDDPKLRTQWYLASSPIGGLVFISADSAEELTVEYEKLYHWRTDPLPPLKDLPPDPEVWAKWLVIACERGKLNPQVQEDVQKWFAQAMKIAKEVK